jgi:hypothetical protein
MGDQPREGVAVRISIYMYIYIYIYITMMFMYINTYVYEYVCVYACIYTYICSITHIYIYVYIYRCWSGVVQLTSDGWKRVSGICGCLSHESPIAEYEVRMRSRKSSLASSRD